MSDDFQSFLEQHAKKNGRFVPARLQAALALLERLRTEPSLDLNNHKDQGSQSIKSHETFGKQAHERLGLTVINKNHGRRSSNLPGWGQQLLNIVGTAGLNSASARKRERIISEFQELFAKPLRELIEQDPLTARLKNRTAENVLRDLLTQAQNKGKAGEVAQYLVGAKLTLRLGKDIPVYPANKSDRTSYGDKAPRRGDFEIENAVIEIAVGLPDEKHLDQIVDILEDSDLEVWLLTSAERLAAWKTEVENFSETAHRRRVVVSSVEAFVGQNITELAAFSAQEKTTQFAALFQIYNDRWVAQVGPPGIRITIG